MTPNDLKTLAEVCDTWRVDPAVVLHPDKYRDFVSRTCCEVALREMARAGVSIRRLQQICPISERALWRCLARARRRISSSQDHICDSESVR